MTVSAVVAFTEPESISARHRSSLMATWSPREKLSGDAPIRPALVLIGHSQGSLMLQLLIANVIEKDPRSPPRHEAGILPGFDLVVLPQGKLLAGRSRKRRYATGRRRDWLRH